MEDSIFKGPISESNNDLMKKIFNKLEDCLNSDVFVFCGSIDDGIEADIKKIIEDVANEKKHNEKLTVILTTNGGSLFAVERIVTIMRNFYKEIDFIVPDYAYSAGTVMCCSGDKIFMDYYSVLGPIDPQIRNKDGKYVAALGYLDKINELINKAKNKKLTDAEFLILKDFDLAELRTYEQARDLAIDLLENWLSKYKFKNWNVHSSNGKKVKESEKKKRAKEIAKELSDNNKWKSHGRPINRKKLQELKLTIDNLEDNIDLYKLVKEYNELMNDYIVKYRIGVFIQTRRFI